MVKKVAHNKYLAKHYLGVRFYIIHDENNKLFFTKEKVSQQLFLQDCLNIALQKRKNVLESSETEIFYNQIKYTDYEGLAETLRLKLKTKGLLEAALPIIFSLYMVIYILFKLYIDIFIICCSWYFFRNYKYLNKKLLFFIQMLFCLISPSSIFFVFFTFTYIENIIDNGR